MKLNKLYEFNMLLNVVERIVKNKKYSNIIKYSDVVVENGSAGIYLIYDEDATVKSISKLYKDVLCLKTVLNFRVTFETDLYHLCIGIEDIDEVEWAEYVRKHYVD